MKKSSKLIRNISLVALSAVLVGSVAATATACGKDKANTLSVFIFCSKSDEHTNRTIADNWAKQYSQTIGKEIKVNLRVNSDKAAYFVDLGTKLNGGRNNIEDIIYLSPRYVQEYSNPPGNGSPIVMDLSQYIEPEAGKTISGIWSDAVSFYGYNKSDANYNFGQKIVYDANGAEGAGFYTESGSSKVGLFGLPKDYSNFSMGYNKKFFTSDMKKAYETTYGSTSRNVGNPSKIAEGNAQYAQAYTGYTKTDTMTTDTNNVATYAVSGTYTLSDGTTKTVEKGQEAPLISIGIPVTYRPFNFYRYNDYKSAKAAGDPIACAGEAFGYDEGYTVTLPGYPGDTFQITDQENAKPSDASSVPYDATIGHTVFTYAEYGALTWAITYYLNTFDWNDKDGDHNATTGNGGIVLDGQKQPVYGSEQYEGAQGNALYLLPWLASNDADLIDKTSKVCLNPDAGTNNSQDAYETAGTAHELRDKMNLDGTTRHSKVQYGMNSKNFMETYGAFQEYGSAWNGNSGNAGDVASKSSKTSSGWVYFRAGASLFYGAGTWDASARNDTQMDIFEFGQMPAPVSEKLALYTTTRDASYYTVTYANATTDKGTGDGVGSAGDESGDYAQRNLTTDPVSRAFTKDEIVKNQIKRQDKWAARMDSVGYAANGRLADLPENSKEAWKAAGAASLIQALTIGKTDQITLTYAGAQLPNYKDQCTDFLKYQETGYENGSFKDMLTPDGFAETKDKTAGRAEWDHYYKIALKMAEDSRNRSNRNVTVKSWIENSGFKHSDGSGAVRYDTQYDNTTLGEFTGENRTNISFAMKVLRMVCFTYADRDLNIRMQYGLNSVRDASMYTPNTTWINSLDASKSDKMFANKNQNLLTSAQKSNFNGSALARTVADSDKKDISFYTPAVYCAISAKTAQDGLK